MPIAEVRRALASTPSEQRDAVAARVQAEEVRLDGVRATAEELTRQISEMEKVMKMTVRGDALKRAVRAAAPMASSSPERPLLQGVLIEARDGSLRAVATDGYRMSVREVPAIAGHDAAFRGAVIASDLSEWVDGLDDSGEVAVEVDGAHLATHGQDRRDFPLIDGTYPDYEVILALREEWYPAIVRAEEFQDAIEDSPDDPVQLSFAGPRVLVQGVDQPVAAQYQGPDIELALDRDYLRGVLSVTAGADLAIEVTDPSSAVYFRSAEDATAVTLLMPVRRNDPPIT